MSSYPDFNKETKEFFWHLIEKYESGFPEFADALNQCIQNIVNDDNLGVLRVHEFGGILEGDDFQKMKRMMSWYFDYVITLAQEPEYEINDDEWL